MKFEGGLAYLTAEEMAEADKLAIDGLGVGVESLMENAGNKTAEVAREVLGGDVAHRKVLVLAGRGNNGGDGLVAARHLDNWGADVTVVLGEGRESLRDVPAKQLALIEKAGARVTTLESNLHGELLIDALLGYGSRGSPREPLAGLIERANASKTPVLAVDLPSGLDATSGVPGVPCVAAGTTVTFGLPKTGFLNPRAKRYVGELYVADISLPRKVYEGYGCPGIFSKKSLLRVW